MKAKHLMTAEPRTCSPDTNLAAAAEIMLAGDCGLLPVLEEGKLVGVVTDRDLYIALATRDRQASNVRIAEVAQSPVYTCSPDDDLEAVLATMKQHHIRRVPVEGFGGTVLGVISLDDMALAAGRAHAVADSAVLETLQALRSHHHAAPQVAVV
jgi:CBS domain-containing protein